MRVKFLCTKQHTALKTISSSLSSKISPSEWKLSCNSKAKNNDPKSAILNLGGKCVRVGMERDRVSQVENTVPFDTNISVIQTGSFGRENLSACKAFVDFWDDHVIIPSVRVFYRHPSLQKKPLMVMCLMPTTSTFSKSI